MLSEAPSRVLVFLAVATCGAIALFFGHVEEYPVLHLAIATYICVGVRRLTRRGGLLLPSVVLAAAMLAHPMGASLVPSWLLLFVRADARNVRSWLGFTVIALTGTYLGTRAVSIGTSTYGGAAALVPLTHAGEYSAYALLSTEHLTTLANETLLVVGGALLLPFLALPRAVARAPSEPLATASARVNHAVRLAPFLVAAAAGTTFAVCVIDPKFGGRDWDLLALPALPLVFLIGYMSLSGREAPPSRAVVILVGAMILHTAPWVWINANRARSVEMVMNVVARDPHYTKPGQKGYRFLGRVLQDAGFREASAVAYLKATDRPDTPVDWHNWARFLMQEKRYEDAVPWLIRAMKSAPGHGGIRGDLATCYARLNRPRDAERVLKEWLAENPDNAEAHLILGSVLFGCGHIDPGMAYMRRSIELAPDSPDAWHVLSAALRSVGRAEEAAHAQEKERALRASVTTR